MKSYLENALHILNQMTDSQMISFALHRLKYSSLLLAAFPSLLRKYFKVALPFWGTGGGAFPVASCLFMRELYICIGSCCIDKFFKGMYKAYVLNCHFVNAVKLKHIRFLNNCGVDLPTAYRHAFIFIRQLAMILRNALNTKTKEAFRKETFGFAFEYRAYFPSSMKENAVFADSAPRFQLLEKEILQRQVHFVIYNLKLFIT